MHHLRHFILLQYFPFHPSTRYNMQNMKLGGLGEVVEIEKSKELEIRRQKLEFTEKRQLAKLEQIEARKRKQFEKKILAIILCPMT